MQTKKNKNLVFERLLETFFLHKNHISCNKIPNRSAMELKVTLDYQQVLEIVRQLSANQMAKLLVDAKHILEEEKKNKDKSSFQKLLLSAPVMTDAQYDDFLDNRKKFNF